MERPALGVVCIYRNVKGSLWIDLRLVLFVYILSLIVAFRETCVGYCLLISYCKSSFWRDLR